MIIDAHQHFWLYEPAEYAWIDDEMMVLRRDYLPGDLLTGDRLRPELMQSCRCRRGSRSRKQSGC